MTAVYQTLGQKISKLWKLLIGIGAQELQFSNM